MFNDSRATSRGQEHDRGGNIDQPCPISARAAHIEQSFAQFGPNTSSEQHVNKGCNFEGAFSLEMQGSKEICS